MLLVKTKEGLLVGLGQEGLHEGGGTILNTLKGGGTEKRREETKVLKSGSNLGQGVGTLKDGAGTPLRTNYVYTSKSCLWPQEEVCSLVRSLKICAEFM